MDKRFKYGLTLLCFFLFQGLVWSQPTKKEQRLDSLLTVYKTYTQEDTLKIDNIARVASAYASFSNYLMALEYWLEAFELSQRLHYKQRSMHYCGSIGVEYTGVGNYPKALEFHLKGLNIAEELHNEETVTWNLNQIGRVYMFLGDYPKALTYYEKALQHSEAEGNKLAMAKELRNIGNTYCKSSNYPKALSYLERSQKLFEDLGNKEGESIGLGVIGTVYYYLNDFEKAITYHRKALEMNRVSGLKRQESMNLLSLGKDYRDAPDKVLLVYGINPSERFQKSMESLNMGRQKAVEIKDQGTEKGAWEDISYTYEKKGDYANAFMAYKNYIRLRDSIEGNEVKNRMAIQEMQFNFDKKEAKMIYDQQLTIEKMKQQELMMCRQQQDLDFNQQQLLVSKQEKDIQHLAFLKTQAELSEQKITGENQQALNAQKDAELKLLNKEKTLQDTKLELTTNDLIAKENQRNAFIVGSVLLLLFAGAVVMGLYRTSAEKKKSEVLLLNILPAEVAMELKQTGTSAAKQYNHVTVLFTDFVNFTGITEELSPTELVAEIHKNFTAFDVIIEKYGLEKIKTIGDAYLAVCGLPNESETHAQQVVKAAIEIQQHVLTSKSRFQIRIGINSGPVVAGIVGVKKYAYDIWGDTVNTAARMEQHSEAGKINISGATYELIKDEFECAYRGKVEAKHKGEVDMYFVNRSFSEE